MTDKPNAIPLTDGQIIAATVGQRLPHNGPIKIVEYDPEWAALYDCVRTRIQAALGGKALLIEHVGSTSVPGLPAKPFIDVLLVVAKSADESAYVPDLEAAGYWLRIREQEWHEHRMLKGLDPDLKLHVFSPRCPEIDRMLLFRDWLRKNESDRKLYERTKRELASRIWKYTQNYADAKSTVVEEILARAMAGR